MPGAVVRSVNDPETRLCLAETMVGLKYLDVVVKVRRRPFRDHGILDEQGEERTCAVADHRIRVWFDPEGDFLEVMIDDRPGFFRETSNDQVMEKVDEEGRVIGFSIMRIGSLRTKPLELSIAR